MKGQYTIDVDRNLISKTHVGQISVDDEIELLDCIMEDPDYRSGMNALCDFSTATVAWPLAELDRFRQYMARAVRRAGDCKWAILFAPGADVSTGRIFVALHTAFETGIRFRMFTDSESAIQWIESEGDED